MNENASNNVFTARRMVWFVLSIGMLSALVFGSVKSLDSSLRRAAVDCFSGDRRCEPGQVNVWNLPEAQLLETTPLERQSLYDAQEANRISSCETKTIELVEFSISKRSFIYYYSCSEESIQYYAAVVGSAVMLFESADSPHARAIVPTYRTYWAWCESNNCPDEPSKLFRIDGGG